MEREIYTISGLTPEETAYSISAFSRSDKSLKETAKSAKSKSGEFVKKFYRDFGHESIGDLAHIPLIFENVSLLAELEIVDEPLWDGMCRSTRYQDFTKTGYYIPELNSILDNELQLERYNSYVQKLFDLYEKWYDISFEYIKEQNPKPEHISEKKYKSKVESKAFDVARGFLPLCMNTSVGQITSIRTAEKQMKRLYKLGSTYPEMSDIANEMYSALVEDPSFDLNKEILNGKLCGVLTLDDADVESLISYSPICPNITNSKETIMSHVSRTHTSHQKEKEEKLREIIDRQIDLLYEEDELNAELKCLESKHENLVDMFHTGKHINNLLDEAIAKLIFANYPHLNFLHCMEITKSLSVEDKDLIIKEFWGRENRDIETERYLQSKPIIFEVTMDIGSYRDLHRHRRVFKYRKPLTTDTYMINHSVFTDYALNREMEIDGNEYITELIEDEYLSEEVKHYLLPLGSATKVLMCMDLADLIYIVDLRSQDAGHYSYKDIAYKMHKSALARSPIFTDRIDEMFLHKPKDYKYYLDKPYHRINLKINF